MYLFVLIFMSLEGCMVMKLAFALCIKLHIFPGLTSQQTFILNHIAYDTQLIKTNSTIKPMALLSCVNGYI